MKKAWITAGHGNLWNCDSTYCYVPDDRLPRIDGVDDRFSWLTDVTEELEKVIENTSVLASEENGIENLDEILNYAAQIGTEIPQSFITFLSNPELQEKVPSCTACYLELSDKLYPIPNKKDHYALRFMNDSQCCVMWYLLLRKEKAPLVFASSVFVEPEIFDLMNDDENPLVYEDIFENILICAESFTEFIYRFWIENTIWYCETENITFSNRQRDYIAGIAKKL